MSSLESSYGSSVSEFCSGTELAPLQSCDSCYSIQNVLKIVGDTLEKCIRSISPDEPNLTAARNEVREDIFWCSQSSAVKRWCDALRDDTLKVTNRVSATLGRNQELEFELRKSKNMLSTHIRDHDVAMEKLKRKSSNLQSELSKEKKEKAEIVKLKTQAEARGKELEREIFQRDEEMKKEAQERNRLQQAANGFEKLQQELKVSQAASCKNLNKIKSHLEDEKKLKEILTTNISELEMEKNQQLEQAEKQTELLENEIEENNRLKAENTKIMQELADVTEENNHKEVCEEQKQQIQRRDQELKILKSQIELLTQYPDLNGPINPPQSDSEDVLLTMENQFRANESRAQVLTSQNERLSGTIKKLRSYMLKTNN